MITLKQQALAVSSLGQGRLDVLAGAIEVTAAANGEVWECGCYLGGTALWMKAHMEEAGRRRQIRVFDTFAGLPIASERDVHKVGAMLAPRASVETLLAGFSDVSVHQGVMPSTFAGLERCLISVAHLDVDQYESVRDCLEWLYPRVHPGGYLVVDDYGCGACPGARAAVDAFMTGKPETLVAPGGGNPQAYLIKR